ncbi:hypothetical protein XBLMG947_0466 [Xanthomonas bromi]|uniref:Radical SAM core domain-containing protein n=1 Tax=Xanthomonas bromi TaxID=56449 RepID=A0A1C3NH69_9XANT|nr:hypothetical protein [Xanthomonas bromi]PPV09054.1 hypothetical protein XbrCFBP1976_00110 [Xanthomonas bromi]SBV49694.1 hypothetical protein XBLMG947_0466 [Xanthomonas bromi]
MHASIDDSSLSPASPLLARLRAAAPSLQRRVPLQDEASRWHALRIGARTYRAALPITFTPYASVRPCSARCGFCSENLRQHGSGRAGAMLRPGPAYFRQLSDALQLLHAVPLSYSLSGLEMTDDAAWLQTLLQTLATTANGPRVEQRVLYTNGAGLAREHGAQLIDALVAFRLSCVVCRVSCVELSRHHPLQERNDAIMRFRADEPIADAATFVHTAQRLAARLPLRLVCIVQRGGVDNADAIARYIACARSCGATQVIFRELSQLDDAYRSNGTLRYIGEHRVGVDTLLAECMQQPWWSRWQPDGLTEGYYFWNVRLRDEAGLQVVFESADYAAMHARHATGDLYKLVFFANGRLCAGWNPDADVLWEPADG